MRKHWTCLRGSEAGRHNLGNHTPRNSHRKKCSIQYWLACLGAVLLVLVVAQGWLILDSTSASRPDITNVNPINPSVSSKTSQLVDTGHLALLDTLWTALPFTHVIKPHEGNSTNGFWYHAHAAQPLASFQHHAERQPQLILSAGSTTGAEPAKQAYSISSTRSSGDGAAAARLPVLRVPLRPEVALMNRLAAAVLRSGLTASEARQTYLAAFQTVSPPRGFPAWQVKLPPTPEAAAAAEAAAQQQQHKGAQFISLDDADSDATVNVTVADFLKSRPKTPTLDDEAAVAAAVAAATAYLARSSAAHRAGTSEQQQIHQEQQQEQQDKQQSSTSEGTEAAELLLRYALLLIKSSHRIAPCAVDDSSLPIDKLLGGPAAPKVLISITGAAGGAQALPNLVLQLLQFVMQTHPGSLYISLVDSSSNSSRSSGDEAAVWMDVLQLLLTPLDVPLLVVQHQVHDADASARNAAIEPFFGSTGFGSCSPGQLGLAASGIDTSADVTVEHGSGSSSAGQPTAMEQFVDDGAAAGADPADGPWHVAGAAGPDTDAQAIPSAAAHEEEDAISSSSAGWVSALLRGQSVGRSLLSRGYFIANFLSAAHRGASGLQETAHASEAAGTSNSNSAIKADPVAAAIAAAFIQPAPQVNSQAAPPRDHPECFNPDWVLFIQASSFFCKSDLQRLLVQTDSDMACAMDMHVAEPSPSPADASSDAETPAQATPAAIEVEIITRHLMRQQQQQQQQTQPQRGSSAALMDWRTKQRRQLLMQQQLQPSTGAQHVSGHAAAAAAAATDAWHERPAALDIWKHPVVYASASVGRMVNGLPFSAAPYYAGGHAPTLRRLVAGLPVQVHCCWGGITKLTAEPFKRGLRFRDDAMQGECSSSAHNMLCDDLHRTGFDKVLLDAGVLLNHDLDVSVKFTQLIKAADRAPFIRRSRWVEVQGAGAPWELSSHSVQQSVKSVQCCHNPIRKQQNVGAHAPQELLVVDEMVQAAAASSRPGSPLPLKGWDAWGCRPVDILSNNHTASFLQSIGVDVT